MILIYHKFRLECIEIKCIDLASNCKLIRGTGITCDDIERYCVLQTPEGWHYYYSQDQYASPPIALAELFAQGQKDPKTRKESWYTIEKADRYPPVVELGDTETTFDTFVVPGKAKAWSVRRNPEAAEIAVETRPEHRGRGYGKQVAATWAANQLAGGKIPFYAHRVGNLASERLARSLRAEKFADIISWQ